MFDDLCGCVYGASPVRFVLSLLYLFAIQMNPVCVVCVWLHLIAVCCFLIVCDRSGWRCSSQKRVMARIIQVRQH